MDTENRIEATRWLPRDGILKEIDDLKWAISSLEDLHAPGSWQKEVFMNAKRGIWYRLDYLHDSVRKKIPEPAIYEKYKGT